MILFAYFTIFYKDIGYASLPHAFPHNIHRRGTCLHLDSHILCRPLIFVHITPALTYLLHPVVQDSLSVLCNRCFHPNLVANTFYKFFFFQHSHSMYYPLLSSFTTFSIREHQGLSASIRYPSHITFPSRMTTAIPCSSSKSASKASIYASSGPYGLST